MTRFSLVASVGLAASFVAAAPIQWGTWPDVVDSDAIASSPIASACTRHHTKTRTRTYSSFAPTDTSAPTSAEPTSVAPEPTGEAPSSSATPSTSDTSAPESSPEVPVNVIVATSSATSTVIPTSAQDTPTATPTSAAPTATATSSMASEGSSGNAEIDAYLKGHNDVRAQHGASPLTWATDLAAAAAKWAENCVWEHSQGQVGSFGENLAAGTGLEAVAAVKMWTDEASEYDPSNPQYSHFTQVVWKATTEVGCAVRTCNNLLSGYSGAVKFHVCEYRKPGNVIGQFAENVQV